MEVRMPDGSNRNLRGHRVQIGDVIYSERDLAISLSLRKRLKIKRIVRVGYNSQIHKKIGETEVVGDDIVTITPVTEFKITPVQAAEVLRRIVKNTGWLMYKMAKDYRDRYIEADSPLYEMSFSLVEFNKFMLALKNAYKNIDSDIRAVLKSDGTDEVKIIEIQGYDWSNKYPKQYPEDEDD